MFDGEKLIGFLKCITKRYLAFAVFLPLIYLITHNKFSHLVYYSKQKHTYNIYVVRTYYVLHTYHIYYWIELKDSR